MPSIDNVNDVTPRRQYIAAAAQVDFDYPFPIFEDEDLVVDVDGVTKALNSDYTVSGEGNDTGGVVSFSTPMTGGEVVTIYRDIAIARDTDFQQNGPFRATAINDEFDKAFLIMQELESKVGRSLRLPITAEVTDAQTELTPLSNWLDRYITIDSNGIPTPAVMSDTTMTGPIIGGLLYPALAPEIAAAAEFGATVNTRYPYGWSERFGATGDGTTDDTAALKAWLKGNDGARLSLAPGNYVISDSLPVYSNVIEGRGSREEAIIRPNGNFECFVNAGHEFIAGAIRQLTIVYNSGVQPTSSSGNDRKIGIYWEVVNGRSPNYFNIEDVEVRGAWWAYYDESGSYGCNFSRFFGWNCQNLFHKQGGTTFTLNQVIGLNCNKGISLNTCLAFSLNACANDGAVVTDGDSVNEFISCTGLAINGWDSESNEIGGNGGCMFKFTDCSGFFSAHVGYLTDFVEDSGYVAMIVCNDSFMEFAGHRPEYNTASNVLTFTGNGTFYHFVAENGSKITVTGGEFPQPNVVSGSPSLVPFIGTGTGRVQVIGASYEGAKGANSFDVLQDQGTVTLTLTGCTTAPTGDIRWSRNGNLVTIKFPQIAATSNTNAATLTGTLPAQVIPDEEQVVLARICDNTVVAAGLLVFGSDGSITLLPSANGGTFTTSGTKGVFSCTVTYSLDG